MPTSSKLRTVRNVLADEGPYQLARRSLLYFLGTTQYGDNLLFQRSRRRLERRMEREAELDDILDTVISIQPGLPPYQLAALQLREELGTLARRAAEIDPTTVLEIGTANGGTLYTWCRFLDTATHVVSLDLPGGEFGGGYSERQQDLFRSFSSGKEMDFVRANSHEERTVQTVVERLGGQSEQPVDFLFIDGDHTYEGVKQDYEMYSPLVRDGGIVAFHDIVNHPDDQSALDLARQADGIEDRHLMWGPAFPDCNVDQFWAELKEEHNTEEIISHPQQTWGGIGVVYL